MQDVSKKESQVVRALLSALGFCLAADLVVRLCTRIALSLAKVRQDELQDEFVYGWIPPASDAVRLFLRLLSIGALALIAPRLQGVPRRAMRVALVAGMVAWINAAFATPRLSGTIVWMADWRVVAALGDITRVGALVTLGFALTAICIRADGTGTGGRTPRVLVAIALALAVAGPLLFWISVALASRAAWLAPARDALSTASQVLVLVLVGVGRRTYTSQ